MKKLSGSWLKIRLFRPDRPWTGQLIFGLNI